MAEGSRRTSARVKYFSSHWRARACSGPGFLEGSGILGQAQAWQVRALRGRPAAQDWTGGGWGRGLAQGWVKRGSVVGVGWPAPRVHLRMWCSTTSWEPLCGSPATQGQVSQSPLSGTYTVQVAQQVGK